MNYAKKKIDQSCPNIFYGVSLFFGNVVVGNIRGVTERGGVNQLPQNQIQDPLRCQYNTKSKLC